MSSIFRNFKSESQKRGERAPMKPRRLATEALEDRRLLAVSPEILTALNGYESFGDYSADAVSTIEIAKDELTLDALNAAISQAASTPGDDAILIVGGGTLTFQPGDKAISIELDDATQGSLTIVGYNGTFEIDANNVDRAFSIKSGTVKLGSIEISNGSADFGGAIANAGDLYLEDAVLSDNVASVSGGAIADKGWISVENSTLLRNFATENGAAIYRGDFEFATDEDVAPEATGTIGDVSAAFGETVEIDLSQYFNEGDWTYSVKLPSELSDALAAEPTVENGVLKLTFVDEATYLEEIEIKDGQKTVTTYKGLTLDLSDVELVVTASNADGSASADSNAFTVGLTERYSARITALLTEMSSDDAFQYEKMNRGKRYYGSAEVPEAETFDVVAGKPISLQIWSEDFAALRGLELESNEAFTFILKLENATLDFDELYGDDGFYSYYFGEPTVGLKTTADGGYSDLASNEYWISIAHNFTQQTNGVIHPATLLASLPLIPTGDGPVSATLKASHYVQDSALRRRFNDETHSVDASQVEFVNASTAASSAAVLSNAEVAAAETTETRAAVLRDVLIAGNSGAQGAIYVAAESTAALLINATVVDNDAAGAAFVSAATGSKAVDSIFVGNGAAVSGVALETVLTDDGAEGALAYDASKPLFADAENGDYSLAKNAQVIDLATGTSASETDLAGVARVSGGAADLGAYEYQGTAPSAPTDVKFGAYDAAGQKATLTWADVADETGYRVEVKKADGAWEVVATLAADATSFDATGLTANASYEYRVSAFNNFGASATVAATVSTLIVPSAPTGLVFTKYDAANAKLTMKWVDNADNEAIYVAVALVGSENWKTQELAADATGCIFTSVDPNKSYVFRVYASNAAGDSDYIEATFNASTDVLTGLNFSTDAPKVGEELAITVAPTTAQVALQWYRVAADGSETAIDGATGATYVPTTADLGLTLKVVATGLNAAYASTVSATSGVVEEKLTAPAAPTGAAFGAYDADSESATLTWVDNADNEAGYRVEVKGADGAWEVVEELAADSTSYVVEGLAAGATYEYRVSAFNDAGASSTVSATITTPEKLTAPVAPTGAAFGAYDADSESATLTWIDNADNEAGYRVEVKGADGAWTVVETLGADATSYVATGLTAGTTYEYRVSAFNDAGASSTVSATITTPEKLTAPVAPTGAAFGAYDADSESATLTWVDNADNEAGYRVEVKGADGSWTVVETLGADAISYVATGLAAGTTYEYRVSAFNDAGASSTVAASITTPEKLTAPVAPTDVKFGAYDADSEEATLTWTDAADNEAGYRVEVKGADGSWTVVETLGADATSYVATGLAAGTTYEYRVSAFNDAGASAAVEATITTPKDEEPEPQVPAAPSNLVFGAYDPITHSLPMSWTDNSDDETAFVVMYSVDGGERWLNAATLKANVAERVATRVWENNDYLFKICARNANGDSDWTYASFSFAADVLTTPTFSTAAPAPDAPIAAVFDSAEANATFQWYRVEADGSETLLEGATNAEYLPTAADVGFRLKVVATSANPAYASTASAVSEVVLETARFKPAAPTNLVFSDYDPATQLMTMTWEDNSINETYFQVEYRKDTGSAAGQWRPSAELGEKPLTVGRDVESRICNRVNDFTHYDFRVRAVYEYVDENGKTQTIASDWAEATFQVARDVVTSVELSTDAPQVGVEISASIPDYVVDQNQGGKQVSVDATFQWYRVVEGVATAIEGATSATYVPTLDDVGCQLRAVATSANAAYVSSAASTTAEVVAETADSRPVPPSDVVFGKYDPETKTLEMSWTNNSETATRIIVEYYRAVSNEWIVSGILNADATGRVAKGVKADTLYQFRVKAVVGSGETALESVYATASFDARRDILEGASFTCDVPTVGEATQVVLDGARNEATFQWYRVDAEGNETPIEGATNAAYVPTASDVGFALKVVATAANGAYNSQISAVTEVVVATPSVPNAPTNVAFGEYNAETKRVELTWNDASNNETGFYVEYSVDGGKTWRASETMDANETSRSAWGLKTGTAYQFRVAAFNTAGVSEWTVASFEVPAPVASAAVLETAFEDDELFDEAFDELDDFFATLD